MLRRALNIAAQGFSGETLVLASALAFSTILALVPLVTVVFSALSLFPVFDDWKLIIEQFIFANFVPATGAVVNEYLQTFRAQAGRLTVVGLLTLMATSLMLLATIENAFNRVFEVVEGRTPGQRILVYWALLTLGPILIVASLAFTSYLLAESVLGDVIRLGSSVESILPTLPMVFEALSFFILYSLAPNTKVSLAPAVYGAIIATVFFEIAKTGFSFYVTRFNSFEVIYGAFGVIPVFLIWVYISWLVILAGGCYTVYFSKPRSV